MSGPDIYILVRTNGDGYGHNSEHYEAWYFDEQEAKAAAKEKGEKFGTWYSVETVKAGTPMPECERW